MRRIAVVILAMSLAACSAVASAPEMQAHAEKYFAAVETGDVNGALALYGSEFYATTPRVKWERMLTHVSRRLGKMQSHTLAGWRALSQIGPGAGNFLELTYDVQYAKYPAREVIVVRRDRSGGEPSIVGHNINSEGLMLE